MPAQFGKCRNLLRSWYGTLSGAPFWTPFHQAIQAIQAHHQGWELHCCWCSLCGGLTCLGLPYSRIVDLCEKEGKTRTGQENAILKSSCEYVSYSYDHIFYKKDNWNPLFMTCFCYRCFMVFPSYMCSRPWHKLPGNWEEKQPQICKQCMESEGTKDGQRIQPGDTPKMILNVVP